MAHMYSNAEIPRRYFWDSLQLTNLVLDSGATCHMIPDILGFIPGSLVETDKYIEVTDGHFVTANQTREVQIKMCDCNGKPFFATLYNILFAPDLCGWLFSIIKLMNSGHNCLFNKGFWTVFFSDNEQNVVTLPHSAQQKHAFLVKMKENSKSQKQIPKKKVSLVIFHHILRHRSTRSLLGGDTEYVWQYIQLRVDPNRFFT